MPTTQKDVNEVPSLTNQAQIIEPNGHSGHVLFSGDTITWIDSGSGRLHIHLPDVMIIGEYTTDEGPVADDWFLCFVYTDGSWDSISMYAENIDSLKQHLAENYHIQLQPCQLTNSTQWHSYIQHPEALQGMPLFTITPPAGYKTPVTIIDYLKHTMGLGIYGKSWTVELSEDAKAWLKGSTRSDGYIPSDRCAIDSTTGSHRLTA